VSVALERCPSCGTSQPQSMTDKWGRETCVTCAAASLFDDEPMTPELLTAPCTATVYPTGKPEPCGEPRHTEWLHYNSDDSRAIDHEYQP
jgi:hypothetical protein